MSMTLDTPHVFTPEPGIIATGQPSAADFDVLADKNVRRVINLRPDGEMDVEEERSRAESKGMTYVHLPISGPQDITFEQAHALHEAIGAHDEGQILIHCGSSNRVGALLALRAHRDLGKTKAEALTYGVRAGLTGLKPRVEQVLSES